MSSAALISGLYCTETNPSVTICAHSASGARGVQQLSSLVKRATVPRIEEKQLVGTSGLLPWMENPGPQPAERTSSRTGYSYGVAVVSVGVTTGAGVQVTAVVVGGVP
jgi:hypothetical protein